MVNLYLDGKIALVTGSTSGIGREISKALIREGATVHGIGRRGDRHIENAREFGSGYRYTVVDLLEKGSIERVAEDVKRLYNRVDILVNNAGTYKAADFSQHTPGEIERILDLNLRTPIQMYRAVIDINIPEQVVWICSRAGLGHYPYESVYEATKHGMKAFVLSAAKEHEKTRHVVVYPGFVLTELTGQLELPDYLKRDLEEEMAIVDPITVVEPLINLMKTVEGSIHVSFIPAKEGVYMNLLKPLEEEAADFELVKPELLAGGVVPLIEK